MSAACGGVPALEVALSQRFSQREYRAFLGLRSVEVDIGPADSGFTGTLRLERHDRPAVTRQFAADRCPDLLRVVVFSLVVLLDEIPVPVSTKREPLRFLDPAAFDEDAPPVRVRPPAQEGPPGPSWAVGASGGVGRGDSDSAVSPTLSIWLRRHGGGVDWGTVLHGGAHFSTGSGTIDSSLSTAGLELGVCHGSPQQGLWLDGCLALHGGAAMFAADGTSRGPLPYLGVGPALRAGVRFRQFRPFISLGARYNVVRSEVRFAGPPSVVAATAHAFAGSVALGILVDVF